MNVTVIRKPIGWHIWNRMGKPETVAYTVALASTGSPRSDLNLHNVLLAMLRLSANPGPSGAFMKNQLRA